MIRTQLPVRRVLLLASATLLALGSACGGSDDAGDENTPTQASGSQSGVSSTPTSQPASSSSSTNIAPDTAVVTIGEKRYEFDMTSPFADTCLTLFGVVGGHGQSVDGSDVSIDIEIPPIGYQTRPGFEDFDPPNIEVDDDENDQEWTAGGDFSFLPYRPADGESQVDSYTSDGKHAQGTATFIDMTALFRSSVGQGERPQPVQGTFEILCN